MTQTPSRIAIVIGQLAVGGGERQLYLMLRSIDRTRFDPVVVTFNPGRDDYWEGPIRELGIPILGVPHAGNNVHRLWAFARLLRQARPAIVHSWDLRFNLATALCGRWAGASVRIGGLRRNLFRPGRRAWHRRLGTLGLDRIVANSARGKQDLLRLGFSPHRIDVVPNVVEPCPPMSAEERAAVREGWGAADATVVASIGSLAAVKNYPLLMQATRTLVGAGWNVRTVVFGDGTLRGHLERLGQEMGLEGALLLVGQDVRARQLIQAADIFCLTSNSEGMPNVLLEAGMAALPVVSTDAGGAREIVVEGVTGHLVPVGDRAALLHRLTSLVSDPLQRRRMGDANRQHVAGQFGVERSARALESVYARSLAHSTAARHKA